MSPDTHDTVAPATHSPAAGSWWRRERYLFWLEVWLDDTIDRRTRKSILREVRDNLVIDAAERGLDEALASLGPARELARDFGAATERRGRPRWGWAAVWFLALLMLWWLVAVTYTLGMLDVLVSTGGTTADAILLGVPVTVFENADGIGIGWRADSPEHFWPLIVAVLAGILAGRLWRVFARRV